MTLYGHHFGGPEWIVVGLLLGSLLVVLAELAVNYRHDRRDAEASPVGWRREPLRRGREVTSSAAFESIEDNEEEAA